MEISSLKRDTSKVESGMWVENIPSMGTLRLKVRGMGSAPYVNALSELQRAVDHSGRNPDGSIIASRILVMTGEAAYRALLLDWDGLTDDGKPVPYDAALAKRWLTEAEYQTFRDAVFWAANVVDNQRATATAALVKNS